MGDCMVNGLRTRISDARTAAASVRPVVQPSRALARGLVALALIGAWVGTAAAYVPDDRWSTTASGSGGAAGDPVTLTWSLVRDGTSIPNESPSNLISYLDGLFGSGPGGGDFTQRPWFRLFAESFDRWSQLGGITFRYEGADGPTPLSTAPGVLGARGDIRIGGAPVDGPSSTLAYTYLPNNGDMVIDTSESSFYSSAANDYRNLRNTIMHELGHAFGLLHINSSTDRLLMEPFIDATFDGPQLDDLRGIQGLYGDALEKSFNGLGNDVASRATSLGSLAASGSLTIGADARGSQTVGAGETDFVSISGTSDVDFFSFTTTASVTLDAALTPLGGVFMQGVEGGAQSSFDANARNTLTVSIFAADGTTLLGSAAASAAGQGASILDLELSSPGTYFARITGAEDRVQLYELALSAVSLVVEATGDFNADGRVDGADFLLWQASLGSTGAGLAADGNRDGVVDAADLAVWRGQFGASSAPTAIAIPEPAAATQFFTIAGALVWACRRRRRFREF
jgi:serralysin